MPTTKRVIPRCCIAALLLVFSTAALALDPVTLIVLRMLRDQRRVAPGQLIGQQRLVPVKDDGGLRAVDADPVHHERIQFHAHSRFGAAAYGHLTDALHLRELLGQNRIGRIVHADARRSIGQEEKIARDRHVAPVGRPAVPAASAASSSRKGLTASSRGSWTAP